MAKTTITKNGQKSINILESVKESVRKQLKSRVKRH